MPGGLESIFYGSMGGLVLVYLVLPLFPLLYVIIRWRAGGQGEPGVGLYAGVLYLRAVAVLAVVTGLALVLHSVVSEDIQRSSMEDMRRIAAGILLGGGIVFGMQAYILGKLQTSEATEAATRIFHGFVLIVSGLASIATILIAAIMVFDKGSDFDDLREPIAWAVVWTATYLLHVRILRASSD